MSVLESCYIIFHVYICPVLFNNPPIMAIWITSILLCFVLFYSLLFSYRLYFFVWDSWRLAATLSRRYRDISYTHCPHACTASPSINILHQSGISVTRNEPTPTQNPWCVLVYSRCCTLYGFRQMYNGMYLPL